MVNYKDNPKYKRVIRKDKNGIKRVVYVLKKHLKEVVVVGRSTYKPSHIRRKKLPAKNLIKKIFQYNNRIRRYQQSNKPQIHNTYIINAHGNIDDKDDLFMLKKDVSTIMFTKFGCMAMDYSNDTIYGEIAHIYSSGNSLYKENDSSHQLTSKGEHINNFICEHECSAQMVDKDHCLKHTRYNPCLLNNKMTINIGNEGIYDMLLGFKEDGSFIPEIIKVEKTIEQCKEPMINVTTIKHEQKKYKLSELIKQHGSGTYIVLACRITQRLLRIYKQFNHIKKFPGNVHPNDIQEFEQYIKKIQNAYRAELRHQNIDYHRLQQAHGNREMISRIMNNRKRRHTNRAEIYNKKIESRLALLDSRLPQESEVTLNPQAGHITP